MRESRASGVLRDLVVIEPHELVYGEYNSDGEGKMSEDGGGKQCRLSGRVIGLVRVVQGQPGRSPDN